MKKRDDIYRELWRCFKAKLQYDKVAILERWVLLTDEPYSLAALAGLLRDRLGVTLEDVGNAEAEQVCDEMDKLLRASSRAELNPTELLILEVLEAEPGVRLPLPKIAAKARKIDSDFSVEYAKQLVGPNGKRCELRKRGLIQHGKGGYFVTR